MAIRPSARTSSTTPYPITQETTGTVPAGPRAAQQAAISAKLGAANPLVDTIHRWVAPFTGTVSIAGSLNLVQNTSPQRTAYKTADGVIASIQLNGTVLYSGADCAYRLFAQDANRGLEHRGEQGRYYLLPGAVHQRRLLRPGGLGQPSPIRTLPLPPTPTISTPTAIASRRTLRCTACAPHKSACP